MSTAERDDDEHDHLVQTEEDESATAALEGEADPQPSLLELLLTQDVTPPPPESRVEGIVVGRIASIDDEGAAYVKFAGTPEAGVLARLMVSLREEDRGREVALMFEGGDPRRPVVIGKMVSPLAAAQDEATADGRRVEINAEQEIVLRCGEASITLTRAGKIIIRGAYVLSRSSGVNRIQGGSVEIN